MMAGFNAFIPETRALCWLSCYNLFMAETRTNQERIHDLTSSGLAQESAILDLRDMLLRAVLYFFSRNPGDLGKLDHDQVLQNAEDCAQDALMAVLKGIPEFRGDSKFSTWAYKFAINTALMFSRRERWRGISLDELETPDGTYFEGLLEDKSETPVPEQAAVQGEVMDVIRDVIERELTAKQRRVLYMMVFNNIPMDEVV